MKNNTIKSISKFLCIVFFIAFINQKYAYGYVDTQLDWSFGILAIGDAQRTYFNDGDFTCDPINMKEGAQTGETYNINTKEVALTIKLTADYYDSSYIRVDEVYIGNSNTDGIFKYFYQNGNSYFNVIIIKNLTPGKHKIEVRQDRPFNLTGDPEQRIDHLYVNVPVFKYDEKLNKKTVLTWVETVFSLYNFSTNTFTKLNFAFKTQIRLF